MITLQYILLHLFLLIVLLYCCKKISISSVHLYWKYAFVAIVVYTLEEGLRWGRETDWNMYYGVYKTLSSGGWTNHEPFFVLLWKLFGVMGLPYPVVISFCSMLFIFSLFFFFKPYKNVIYLAVPLSVACHITTSSNLIRWYMAVSLCLISVALFESQKRKIGLLFFCLSFLTHYAIVLTVMFYAICKIKKTITKPVTAVVVCILLLLFFDKSFLSNFSFIYKLFGEINRFSGYLEGGFSRLATANETKSFAMTLFTFVPFFAFIIYGYRLKRNGLISPIHYNMVVVASYFKIISSGLEFFSRYYYLLDFFVCLVASHVIIYLKKQHYGIIAKVLFAFCVLYLIRKYIYMCSPFKYDEFMLYVWNNRIDPQDLYYFRRSLQQWE